MKTHNKHNITFLFLLGALLAFSSCKKENTTPNEQEARAQEEAVAISTSGTFMASTSGSDSVYVMDACPKGNKKSDLTVDALPAATTAYLSANYAGHSAIKVFKIANINTNATHSFLVIIKFNQKIVALRFDADGNFVKVLELRERIDLHGKGWHLGGWFEHRNGLQKDTIAISDLPATIQTYFAVNYTEDVLLHALKNKDGSIIVLSRNTEFYATAFTSAGILIKRVQVPSFAGKAEAVAKAALIANIKTYLDTTYPDYVFKKAFSIRLNGTLKGYLVVIDANLTKYAVRFDAEGNFVSAVAIR